MMDLSTKDLSILEQFEMNQLLDIYSWSGIGRPSTVEHFDMSSVISDGYF